MSKGIMLAASAVVSLVVPLVTGVNDATLTGTQLPATQASQVDPETRFEVVSIKPSEPFTVPRMSISAGLYNAAGLRVIDKSGLTSFYNVTLKWTREAGSASPALVPLPSGTIALDPDAPNLFTAMQEQLGLKLENARAPLDVVVIDHIEQPTPD